MRPFTTRSKHLGCESRGDCLSGILTAVSCGLCSYTPCFACCPGRRQGMWKQVLDTTLLEALQAPPYGLEYEETVSHLLRAVRNTAEHITEWGQEAHDAVGHDKAAILDYFCGSTFPRLLIGVWQWACREKECLEDAYVGELLEPAFGT